MTPIDIERGPTTVLILEDLQDTLAWLEQVVLTAFPGVKVSTASTLKAAVEMTSAQTFDLALVDLGLPDGSGLDLIRHLRRQTDQTYIVVASIYDDDEHLLDALRCGANGYLLKDEPPEQLVELLQDISESRPPLSNRALEKVVAHFNKQSRDQVYLTGREEDVLRLVAKGYNVNESAEMLGLSTNTVKGYLKTVYSKLGISSRAEATAEAIKRQLIAV